MGRFYPPMRGHDGVSSSSSPKGTLNSAQRRPHSPSNPTAIPHSSSAEAAAAAKAAASSASSAPVGIRHQRRRVSDFDDTWSRPYPAPAADGDDEEGRFGYDDEEDEEIQFSFSRSRSESTSASASAEDDHHDQKAGPGQVCVQGGGPAAVDQDEGSVFQHDDVDDEGEVYDDAMSRVASLVSRGVTLSHFSRVNCVVFVCLRAWFFPMPFLAQRAVICDSI